LTHAHIALQFAVLDRLSFSNLFERRGEPNAGCHASRIATLVSGCGGRGKSACMAEGDFYLLARQLTP